jgi:uncharacterized protein (DUF362 family)
MKISRREFLRWTALGAGAAAGARVLSACAASPEGGKTRLQPPTPAPGSTYLAVARGGDDPEALTRAAVDAVGGMARFVPSGARVLIKPNMCVSRHSYELAATTNPWVVGALVKMCYEAGAASVLVYDFPFDGSSKTAWGDSGIGAQVTVAGGRIEYVDGKKFIPATLPDGHSLTSAEFYSEVTNADVLINAPIAKHHSTAGLTLGMKNLMGAIHHRQEIHDDLHRRIADLADYLRPELNVVDAVRIRIANGPQGECPSDVRKIDTVIASADIVAADAYATRLFGWTDPNRLGYVKYGNEWGIGRSDLENLRIADIAVG